MTVTIVETRAQACAITGGVDTHADVHVAAALDPVGGLLGVREFPADPAGYARLAGVARRVRNRMPGRHRRDRQLRRWAGPAHRRGRHPGRGGGAGRTGRTGVAGASPARWMRSAPPGPPSPAGRPARRRAGQVEAIRALMADGRSARSERIQTTGQARSLIVTGPDDLRARFAGHCAGDLAVRAGLAAAAPRQHDPLPHPAVPARAGAARGVPRAASCSASMR